MSIARLKGKEGVKVHFDITIKTAEGLPISSGNVYLTWKRGKKSGNSGETKHALVGKDKKAQFDEGISLSCTLYKDKKGYESKNLAITLKEEKGKKGNSLAKAVVDLAEFIGAKDDKRSFSLKSKKSRTPVTLAVIIKSKETELSPDDEPSVTDASDTSLSDDEDAEDFQDDDPKHKEKSTPVKESKRDVEKSSPAPSLSSSSSREVDDLRAELDKAKRRTRELATENVDQEEQIENLTKQLEDLKKSGGQSPATAMSPEKEVELKKRIKELASENVDMEEQITELKVQVEQLKKQQVEAKPNGIRSSAKEEELSKKIQELQDAIKEKDAVISSQKQDLDRIKQSAKDNDKTNEKNDLRAKIKELAAGSSDMEDQIKELKKEIDNLRKGSSKDAGDASIKIRELTETIKRKDGQIEDLQDEIDRLALKQQGKEGDIKAEYQQKIQELNSDIKEKAATISSLKQEVERLKRDIQEAQKNDKSGSTDREVADLRKKLDSSANEKASLTRERDDIATQIEVLKEEAEDLKSKRAIAKAKLEDSQARERSLQSRVEELEESNERLEAAAAASATSSAVNLTRDRDREKDRERRERERTERDKVEKERRQEREELEKEKELRIKAEKEVRTLRDKLDISVQSNRDKRAPENTSGEDSSIVTVLYETPASYRNEDGVSLCAAELWEILSQHDAFNDSAISSKVINALEKSVLRMPYDMNALFYWLSTTTALLHMLRDQPGVDSDNDRDPIIDGVYKVEQKPYSNSTLQDQLEWVAFLTFESLAKIICKKLEPVLVSTIIDQSMDVKKSAVSATATTRVLDRVLHKTHDHFLYDAVVQQLFCQIFYFINANLVNAALKKERLTASHGVQIKYGISKLDEWLANACSEFGERSLLSPASDRLDALREVANALVVDKTLFSDVSATQSVSMMCQGGG